MGRHDSPRDMAVVGLRVTAVMTTATSSACTVKPPRYSSDPAVPSAVTHIARRPAAASPARIGRALDPGVGALRSWCRSATATTAPMRIEPMRLSVPRYARSTSVLANQAMSTAETAAAPAATNPRVRALPLSRPRTRTTTKGHSR